MKSINPTNEFRRLNAIGPSKPIVITDYFYPLIQCNLRHRNTPFIVKIGQMDVVLNVGRKTITASEKRPQKTQINGHQKTLRKDCATDTYRQRFAIRGTRDYPLWETKEGTKR